MRDPTVLVWPDAFAPRSMTVTIDRPVFKGPKPLDGREQVVSSSAGGWLISYEGVPVWSARYNQFRPMWMSLAAYARPVYVKPDYTENMLARRNNISAIKTKYGAQNVAHSDGSQFTQSTGDCILAANAKRNDVVLTVTNSTVSPVTAGDYFELDGRLHNVRAIDGNKWSIWPPLRKNAANGTVLEIDDPRLLAYMTTDSRGVAMQTEARNISFMNIDFIEANW